MSQDAKLLEQLKQKVQGLIYQSEMDARYRPFSWRVDGFLTPAVVLRKLNLSPRVAIHPLNLEMFFQNVVKPLTPCSDLDHTPSVHRASQTAIDVVDVDPAQQAHRGQLLVTWLQDNLQELQVFQVGQVDTELVVVGRASEDRWLGLQIQVVEA
ncbi:nuclease A inhibitor family protein [Prochlorothrix hollandica]|uniref:nuclease A inhibitor family protein n=1 Tax=Prochlorothrix hollandica TaxID=1223 RepID=UPI0003451F4D|nr:nuclease A inhibitor family protein [Prochlorothrix hollandica]